MSDTTQGPVESYESRTTRPMPKGLLLGGVAVLGVIVLMGSFILSGGSRSDGGDAAGFADDPQALAGDVEAEPGPGRATTDVGLEAPPVGLDGVPIGVADPEPTPVLPWEDEQARLEARLATVEQDLERLRQRHAVVAADLDTLVAGEPWAQAEAVRVADPAALEAVEDQAERLQSLEGRLSRLEAAQRARAAATAPPFHLVAIDWWNGEPYATLRSQGRYTRIQEGESVSGWALERIDATRREAAFRQADRVVRLTAHGG
jgi:hypothetical protein